ncbi:hypothetical protein LXL04_003160 [Taraxacum kok-saghyz]
MPHVMSQFEDPDVVVALLLPYLFHQLSLLSISAPSIGFFSTRPVIEKIEGWWHNVRSTSQLQQMTQVFSVWFAAAGDSEDTIRGGDPYLAFLGFARDFKEVDEKLLTPTLKALKSDFFENSYIPENPRTLKSLTFSKNRLRGAKNCSNTSPIVKKIRKNILFFKNFAYVQKKICTYAYFQFCFFLHMCIFQKKKLANYNYYERFGGSRSRFFEMNNGLGDVGNWGISQVLENI